MSSNGPVLHSRRRDPDRLLPADDRSRGVARDLYERVADLPILSPHGHVDPGLLLRDQPFADAADLLVVHDHYVTRLLHAAGVDLAHLVGRPGRPIDAREVWRTLTRHWHLFAGTASGYWLEEALDGVLDIDPAFDPASADAVFDAIADRLARPEMRPRALLQRFRIEFLATTDDPLDDLAVHRSLAAAGLPGRVVPTFRPDRYLDPAAAGFREAVARLLDAESAPTTFAGYLEALARRRAHFRRHGAVSADHGVVDPETFELAPTDAERLFQRVIGDPGVEPNDVRMFRGHMLLQMARMSVEDGLVMTVHAGVHRNHSSATLERFGPDTGHDLPLPTSFVQGLRPLLERYGLEPDFHLVLFTVDETAFSRDLAPLAGFYPSVYIGAPWWFLDAPDAIQRFRSAVTETAGFYRGSGFIDDTRAFLSIPARHDTARRSDAAFLARLVTQGRISADTARRVIVDLTDSIPRAVFKL